MMLPKILFLFAPLVLLSPATSHADSSEVSNYDECIVYSLRGVSSDVAASAIIESCRNLFPEAPIAAAPPAAAPPATPRPELAAPAAVAASSAATGARSLTTNELARLRSRAKVFGSTYRVTIDNGLPNLTLTEVTIAVWDEGDPVASRKEYKEAVQIAPQTSAMVKYTVHYRGEETGWQWSVVAARGVE